MNNRTKRKVISFTLSFFLTLSILGMFLFAEAKVGLLKKENLRTSLVKSDYIDQVEEKVEAELKSLLEERGLAPELAETVLTYDSIYMDMSNYMDAVFSGKGAIISTAEFEENLQSQITYYIKSQGAILSDQVNESIAELVTIAASSYKQYVTPKAIVTVSNFMDSISRNITLVGTVSAVITILLTILLLCLYRYKHHGMAYLIYSAIAAVLVNGAGAIVLAKTNFVDGLGVGPQYYLEFVHEFIKVAVRECYMVTAIGAAIVLLLFLLRRIVRTISIQ